MKVKYSHSVQILLEDFIVRNFIKLVTDKKLSKDNSIIRGMRKIQRTTNV